MTKTSTSPPHSIKETIFSSQQTVARCDRAIEQRVQNHQREFHDSDPNWRDQQAPSSRLRGLHEKYNALLDSVDGSDYSPPTQSRDVEAKLTIQLERIENELWGLIADYSQGIAPTGSPAEGGS